MYESVVVFLSEHSPQKLHEFQLNDPIIEPVLQEVEKNERLQSDMVACSGPELRWLVEL